MDSKNIVSFANMMYIIIPSVVLVKMAVNNRKNNLRILNAQ